MQTIRHTPLRATPATMARSLVEDVTCPEGTHGCDSGVGDRALSQSWPRHEPSAKGDRPGAARDRALERDPHPSRVDLEPGEGVHCHAIGTAAVGARDQGRAD